MDHEAAARTINRNVLSAMFSTFMPAFDSREARVLLLAIQRQEDPAMRRVQVLDGGRQGPARGLWQFERAGGVRGVLTHKASAGIAVDICDARRVIPSTRHVWPALQRDDILAAAFARLLLWTDPRPLPHVGDVDGAWDYYVRNWRPGKPHPEFWPERHAAAVAAINNR